MLAFVEDGLIERAETPTVDGPLADDGAAVDAEEEADGVEEAVEAVVEGVEAVVEVDGLLDDGAVGDAEVGDIETVDFPGDVGAEDEVPVGDFPVGPGVELP